MFLVPRTMAKAPSVLLTIWLATMTRHHVQADSCSAFNVNGACYELGSSIETVTGELDSMVKEAGSDGFMSLYDNFLAPMVNMFIAADDPTGFCFGDYTGDEVDENLEDYGCDFIPLDANQQFGIVSGSLPITTEMQLALMALQLWTNVQPETVTPKFCMAMRVPSPTCHKMTFAMTINDGTITALCEIVPAGGIGDAILSVLAAIVELGVEQVGFGMSIGGGLDVPVKYYVNKEFKASTFPSHLYFNILGSIELPFLPEQYQEIISCEGEFARAFNFGDTIDAVSSVVTDVFNPSNFGRADLKGTLDTLQDLLLFPEVVTTEARLTIDLEEVTDGLLQNLALGDTTMMAMKVPKKKLGNIEPGFYLSIETNLEVLEAFAKQLCDQIDGALKAVSGGGCPKLPNLSIKGKIGIQIQADRIEAFIQVPGFLIECQVWNLNPLEGKTPKMSCQVDSVIFEIVAEALGYLIGKAEEMGKEIVEDVTEISKDAVKAAKGFGKEVAGFAKLSSKAADHFAGEVGDFFEDGGQELLDVANRALKEAENFQKVAEAAAFKASRAADEAGKAVDRAAQEVAKEVERLSNEAKQAAETAMRIAEEKATKLADEAKEKAEEAARETERIANEVAEEAKKEAEEAAEAAKSTAEGALNAVRKLGWRRLRADGEEESALDFEDEDEDHDHYEYLDVGAGDTVEQGDRHRHADVDATDSLTEGDEEKLSDGPVYMFSHVFSDDDINDMGLSDHVQAGNGILSYDEKTVAALREQRELIKTDTERKHDEMKRNKVSADNKYQAAQAALEAAEAEVLAAQEETKHKPVGMGFIQHYQCKNKKEIWDSSRREDYGHYFAQKGNDDSRKSCFESCYEWYKTNNKSKRHPLCCEYETGEDTGACRVGSEGRIKARKESKSASLTFVKDFGSMAEAKSIRATCSSDKECYTSFCDNGRCKVKCAPENRCYQSLYSKCFGFDGNCLNVGGVNHFCDKATDSCTCDDSTGQCTPEERQETVIDLFPHQVKEDIDMERVDVKPAKMLPNKKNKKEKKKDEDEEDERPKMAKKKKPRKPKDPDDYGERPPSPGRPVGGGGYSRAPPQGSNGQIIVSAPEVIIRAGRIVVEPVGGESYGQVPPVATIDSSNGGGGRGRGERGGGGGLRGRPVRGRPVRGRPVRGRNGPDDGEEGEYEEEEEDEYEEEEEDEYEEEEEDEYEETEEDEYEETEEDEYEAEDGDLDEGDFFNGGVLKDIDGNDIHDQVKGITKDLPSNFKPQVIGKPTIQGGPAVKTPKISKVVTKPALNIHDLKKQIGKIETRKKDPRKKKPRKKPPRKKL
ncbi:expressed unknown protein [Seminavis robusta]|uniref:Uncharacterized protein n=1 Tax=Seminavis robusta TaxID=568900 RepID=A0A9N8EZR9_9STRA|nr:expressed unknown protein [Seminavis robusta]|eukprot:Sro2304_g322580.1 n/a (1316) ;mRNA; f:4435-9485